MNRQSHDIKAWMVTCVLPVFLMACSAVPTKPMGADAARNKLTQLQSDSQLASRAPVDIKQAEVAVRAAEEPREDSKEEQALASHLVLMADRKVEVATALAQARLLEDQRKALTEQRESARLEARTLEADRAHMQTEALQQQIADLNAKSTDRGLVMTLGDLLFETGKAELKHGAVANLGKLAVFLNEHPERSVSIEGHTDNVGSESTNFSLSQRRADSVRSYLMQLGINASRIVASGKGENYPVASNDSATGRQMNRRVEIIIANPADMSSR